MVQLLFVEHMVNWAVAGMDRNGLRPIRYTLTEKLLIAGSETGMVSVNESDIVERGRVGPGQLIAVNFEEKNSIKIIK